MELDTTMTEMLAAVTLNEQEVPGEHHDGGGDRIVSKQPSDDDESTPVAGTSARAGGDAGNTKTISFFEEVVNRPTNIYCTTKAIPLKSPWSFWVDRTRNGMNAQEFALGLHHISTAYSVHEFWRIISNVPLPSTLDIHTNMHFTRDVRFPIWEEAYNSQGGTFRFRVAKRDTDKVWRELLLTTAAEHWFNFIDEADDIVGISVAIRDREDLFMIWNKDAALAKDAEVFNCIQLTLPNVLLTGGFYKPHADHFAFEKRLAAAAATSSEGILNVLKHSGSDEGHRGRRIDRRGVGSGTPRYGRTML